MVRFVRCADKERKKFLMKQNFYLLMYIHHFFEGFVNSRHSNDDKFSGASLVDHKMLTPVLNPKSITKARSQWVTIQNNPLAKTLMISRISLFSPFSLIHSKICCGTKFACKTHDIGWEILQDNILRQLKVLNTFWIFRRVNRPLQRLQYWYVT